MRIEFDVIIDDLNKEHYSFWQNNFVLYLDKYKLLTRKTKKHSHKAIKTYERLFDSYANIKKEDVSFTEDIKQKALDVLLSQMSVEIWDKK